MGSAWAAAPVHWAEALVAAGAGVVLLLSRRTRLRWGAGASVYIPFYLIVRGWWRAAAQPWVLALLLVAVVLGIRELRRRRVADAVLWTCLGIGLASVVVAGLGFALDIEVTEVVSAASVAAVGFLAYVAGLAWRDHCRRRLCRVGAVGLVVVAAATGWHLWQLRGLLQRADEPGAWRQVRELNRKTRVPGITLRAGRAEVERRLARGDTQGALEVVRELAERYPELPAHALLHARVLRSSGSSEELTWLAKAVSMGPLPNGDRRRAARRLLLAGWVEPWAQGWRWMGTADGDLFSNPSYAFRLAVALRLRRELQGARDVLRGLAGLIPESWRAYELGRVAEEDGNGDAAASWYMTSLQQSPVLADSRRRLRGRGQETAGGRVLGELVRFKRWRLEPCQVKPGDSLRLALALEALDFPPDEYRLFVHFEESLHPQHRFQGDHDPQGGRRPTTAWRPGEVVADTCWIAVPADAVPGRYKVWAGLFAPRGSKPRVGRPGGDRADLGWITVLEPRALNLSAPQGVGRGGNCTRAEG